MTSVLNAFVLLNFSVAMKRLYKFYIISHSLELRLDDDQGLVTAICPVSSYSFSSNLLFISHSSFYLRSLGPFSCAKSVGEMSPSSLRQSLSSL